MIETERLVLRRWRESDRPAWHAMGRDPAVMCGFSQSGAWGWMKSSAGTRTMPSRSISPQLRALPSTVIAATVGTSRLAQAQSRLACAPSRA